MDNKSYLNVDVSFVTFHLDVSIGAMDVVVIYVAVEKQNTQH